MHNAQFDSIPVGLRQRLFRKNRAVTFTYGSHIQRSVPHQHVIHMIQSWEVLYVQ
jgi:hypothetical protein